MSYVVLARKWRPHTFEDLIGQEYIVRTLKNAVESGRIAHAMIFSGPHGVGKTSTARILAGELNRAQSGEGSDSKNDFYEDIEEGKSLDVIEIDAASHTGVNDVREIIENLKYMPFAGNTKVYIIDEAHMLSQSAFNALLKSLEEPPPHILFILATTEVHKIPATILSRCQRYEFKKVPTVQIKERIEKITQEEGIEISPETLYTLAEEAEGSMRDALSLLDQLVATFGASIEEEDAARILGLSDRSLIKAAFKAILDHDPKGSLEALNEAAAKGANPKRFAEDLLKLVRRALVIKACGSNVLMDLSEDETSSIQDLIERTTVETLEMLFKFALEGAEEVHRSPYPRMALEASIVKLALVRNVIPIEEILKKLEAGPDETESPGGGSGKKNPRKNVARKASNRTRYEASADTVSPPPTAPPGPESPSHEPPTAAPPAPPAESPPPSGSHTRDELDFINFVRSNSVMIASNLEEASRIYLEDSTLRVQFPSEDIHTRILSDKKRLTDLEQYASAHYRDKIRVKIDVTKSLNGSTTTVPKSPTIQERRTNASKDPLVAHALTLFGGRIIAVKSLDKE